MSFDSIDQRRHQLLAQAASRLNYFETNNNNTTKTLESKKSPRADLLLTKEAKRNIPYTIYVNNKHTKTNSTFKTEAYRDDDDDNNNYEYDTTRIHSENVCFILA